MSEIPRPSNDEFDALMAGFESDPAFSNTVAKLAKDMNAADSKTSPAADVVSGATLAQFERAHVEQPLDNVVAEIIARFLAICEEFGVNPNALDPTTEMYAPIEEALAAEVYNLRKEIWPGDIVISTDSLVIDLDEANEMMHVVGVFGGHKIVGTFFSPVIGPMPDETNAITLSDTNTPAIGVGFMIKDPIIIDEKGEAHPDVFAGDVAIIALDIQGSKLARCQFLEDV